VGFAGKGPRKEEKFELNNFGGPSKMKRAWRRTPASEKKKKENHRKNTFSKNNGCIFVDKSIW